MLPKSVYSKIVQSLKWIKKEWDEDRKENPNITPYEIDPILKDSIEQHIKEGNVRYNGRQGMEALVNETCDYLVKKNKIIKSPYGGHMFPLASGVILPTKKQLIKETIMLWQKENS